MRGRHVVFAQYEGYEPRPLMQRVRRWHIEDADTITYGLIAALTLIVSPFIGLGVWATWHEILYYFSS